MAITELNINPNEFWNLSIVDLFLLNKRKENEYKSDMEKRAWMISWLTRPHIKKAIEPKKIFNFEEMKKKSLMTKEEEAQQFEEMFMTKEQRSIRESQKIKEALLKVIESKGVSNG